MKRLIERRADITAVATLNDMIAIGAIDAIIDAGKRVPEDYSVCGIDNVSAARYRGVSLTSVESYPIQAGHEAVSYLVRRIEQEGSLSDIEDMPESIMRIEYIPKLIVRKSTGPRRK
jgi:LacI family transcriptional regulator